ncbi:hypothetical protein [Clostridium sp. OS1-26]|uniref:hypothetical protein n=1 Tax=Clostridium sp. OS1-26 TaxID=3070681 RepID=UPI0027E15DF5|nr:hypothetical protein [Clostridium sp. OS1-26]WML35653.1 hypothetical protein RCG18_02555 [Clostridium sp. OS1-26]
MFDFNNPFFLSIVNGIIGGVLACIVTTVVSFKSIKAQRQYYTELQVIPDKVLNPLLGEYNKIKDREKINPKELISSAIYKNIDSIFENNICWYFLSNKEIKPILVNIRDYSRDKNEEKLKSELKNLYETIEKVYVSKYK